MRFSGGECDHRASDIAGLTRRLRAGATEWPQAVDSGVPNGAEKVHRRSAIIAPAKPIEFLLAVAGHEHLHAFAPA